MAAFDGAIDNKREAYEWLRKYEFDILVLLAEAIHNKPKALVWFKENDLEIFNMVALKIRTWGESQQFDYHKLHW